MGGPPNWELGDRLTTRRKNKACYKVLHWTLGAVVNTVMNFRVP